MFPLSAWLDPGVLRFSIPRFSHQTSGDFSVANRKKLCPLRAAVSQPAPGSSSACPSLFRLRMPPPPPPSCALNLSRASLWRSSPSANSGHRSPRRRPTPALRIHVRRSVCTLRPRRSHKTRTRPTAAYGIHRLARPPGSTSASAGPPAVCDRLGPTRPLFISICALLLTPPDLSTGAGLPLARRLAARPARPLRHSVK